MSTAPRLSLRRHPVVKPPPPGVKLATELPRSENLKLGDIVSRTRESADRHDHRLSEVLEKREAVLAKAEAALAAKEHEIREREAAVAEREREALETIKLAEVREASAEQKEALLAENRDALAQAKVLARLQAELTRRDEAVAELEASLQAAKAEIEGLEKALEHTPPSPSPIEGSTADGPQAQVDDAVALLLAEREAFIEESENTLFHRAQELQELELHLQQWQEVLNARAKEFGVLGEAPEALVVADDPAQDESLVE